MEESDMKHRYLKNVVSLALDDDKCTGCSMCIEVCPHQVFVLLNSKAHIDDLDACMECGGCAMNCPFSAITVNVGVGCFRAVMNGKLGGSGDCCC